MLGSCQVNIKRLVLLGVLLYSLSISMFGLALSPLMESFSFIPRVLSVLFVNILWLVIFFRARKVKAYEALFCFFYSSMILYILILNFFRGYGLIGFLNHWTMYLGYFPLIFLIRYLYRVWGQQRLLSFVDINFLFICLMFLGVIFDGLMHLNDLVGLGGFNRIDHDSLRRANFLLASPTAIFIMAGVGLVLADFRGYGVFVSVMYLVLSCLAVWMTYSRFPLILYVLSVFGYIFSRAYSIPLVGRFLVLSLFIIFSMTVFYVGEGIILLVAESNFSKFLEVFSVYDLGNNLRFQAYASVITYIFSFPDAAFGYGVGAASINLSNVTGGQYLGHFESSFLSMILEVGWLFFVILMFLFIFSMIRAFKYSFFVGFVFFLMCINIALVPIFNGYQVPYLFALVLAIINCAGSTLKKNKDLG